MTLLTLLVTGVAYPLVVTGVAQLAFPRAADGSLVVSGGQVVGSELIGQGFASDRYFHSRPSAAGGTATTRRRPRHRTWGPQAGRSSRRSRTGSTRVVATEQGVRRGDVPVDLVTSSGSGLDPDISPDAAMLQVARVARVRGLDRGAVRSLVDAARDARGSSGFSASRGSTCSS